MNKIQDINKPNVENYCKNLEQDLEHFLKYKTYQDMKIKNYFGKKVDRVPNFEDVYNEIACPKCHEKIFFILNYIHQCRFCTYTFCDCNIKCYHGCDSINRTGPTLREKSILLILGVLTAVTFVLEIYEKYKMTLENIHSLHGPYRLNLNVSDLENFLLYGYDNNLIGTLKPTNLPNVSIIHYLTVPLMQSAINRLVQTCPILRSMQWEYSQDVGNVYRMYPNCAKHNLESVHTNEFDNENYV